MSEFAILEGKKVVRVPTVTEWGVWLEKHRNEKRVARTGGVDRS